MDVAIDGVGVGHRTDAGARTGCTVVLLPEGNTASGEVRGGAPATREFALLDPVRSVASVDAVVLSGGSAFGLVAADGVVAALERQGRGFPTTAATVPIVVGMSLYDLAVGDAATRPTAEDGAAALDDAVRDVGAQVRAGGVGAGAGATVGGWRGPEHRRPGGIGVAETRDGELWVTALLAVNASGDIDHGDGARRFAEDPSVMVDASPLGENTTIGVVVTNAGLDKVGCHVLAQGAHDGLARAVFPPHTAADGDAFVAVSVGDLGAPRHRVRAMTVAAVEAAIRSVDRGP